MATLRKTTEKSFVEDDELDSDEEYSEEEFSMAHLHKGNEETYDIDKRIMARYGTNVDQKKSLTNYYIKFIGVLIVLILIPAEIVLRNKIFEVELLAINSYQTIIRELGKGTEDFFKWFCILFTWIGRYLFVKWAAAFLYLTADPVLGFKSAITLYIGAFVISMIKLFYKVPRPFWISDKVKGIEWLMDFSGPSDNQFFMVFFYSYNIIIYLILYSEKRYTKLAALMLSLNSFVVVIAALCLNYLGTVFYLESIIGAVYGIIYTAIWLNLDSEFHRVSEMTAFIIKTSKKYKFYFLFVSLAAFWVGVIYYNAELITWRVPQQWILNSQKYWDFDENFEIRLGIDDTFKETSSIFGLIGLAFGASNATKTVDSVTWAYTTWWKRLIRGLIGIFLYVGIFVAFAFIPRVDLPTAYFFNWVIPHLVATYTLYGLVPIACKYVGLVQKKENIAGTMNDSKKDPVMQTTAINQEDDDSGEEEKTPGDFREKGKEEREEPLISSDDKKDL
jgi:hypothetical protein